MYEFSELYGRSIRTSPSNTLCRCRRISVRCSSRSVSNFVLLRPPIIIKAATRSFGSALTKLRNAAVLITGPVAHLVAIFSECKLNNIFCIAAEADAYYRALW